MNLTELLKSEIEYGFKTTEGLMDQVGDLALDWKPSDANNWMTTGQLLFHLATSCGMPSKGFVTGDWGFPDGVDVENIPKEEMMPPAEKMQSVESLDQAKSMFAEDKKVALEMVDQAGEERLQNDPTPAPWDPSPAPLGQRLLQMVQHQAAHKSQLFYYLKLQGKPVNTMHLWGMG